jgi:hypothetical protein
MKGLLLKYDVPFTLKMDKLIYEACIICRQKDYLIRYYFLIDSDWLCFNDEMIEGSGKTLEDAITDLKVCLTNNELI